MVSRRPHVLLLGGGFAGLAAARHIRKLCGDRTSLTLVDAKPYLVFIPNILVDILAGHDPVETLHMPTVGILHKEDIRFIQAEVDYIDLEGETVRYTPSARPGAASEYIGYDYLVIALGARLAYDKIAGFDRNGHSFSDTYYGNKLRSMLFGGGYRGGRIAIGSERFHGRPKGAYNQMPDVMAACEYPIIEAALSFCSWLEDRGIARPGDITLFTPGAGPAVEAGEHISGRITKEASGVGINLLCDTGGIRRIASWGIEFENGAETEAEIKIALPDWEAHELLKELPITDEAGFVVTDRFMRCRDVPNVFAVGDCAALTVPKLGELGDKQARVVAGALAGELGISRRHADEPFAPEIIFIGDMGRDRAFYIHSDVCYGGGTSVFKTGYSYYSLKLGFKEVFFRTGGRPPSWGIPLAELVAEHLT